MSEGNRLDAYAEVQRALRNGTLTRPECCSRCGDKPEKGWRGRSMIHGHHDDYSKPLDVMWLCPQCHADRHKELGWGLGGEVTRQIRKGRTKAQYLAIHRARFRAQYPRIPQAA